MPVVAGVKGYNTIVGTAIRDFDRTIVPFRQGDVQAITQLSLIAHGAGSAPVKYQFSVVAMHNTWPDGSVRLAKLHYTADFPAAASASVPGEVLFDVWAGPLNERFLDGTCNATLRVEGGSSPGVGVLERTCDALLVGGGGPGEGMLEATCDGHLAAPGGGDIGVLEKLCNAILTAESQVDATCDATLVAGNSLEALSNANLKQTDKLLDATCDAMLRRETIRSPGQGEIHLRAVTRPRTRLKAVTRNYRSGMPQSVPAGSPAFPVAVPAATAVVSTPGGGGDGPSSGSGPLPGPVGGAVGGTDYQMFRGRDRIGGDVIWSEFIVESDPDLPYEKWWAMYGFNDSRNAVLGYTMPYELQVAAFSGGEVGVYWADRKGAVKFNELGPQPHFRLTRVGETFMDAQACAWRGARTQANIQAHPDPYLRASALAICASVRAPVWSMATNWKESGAFAHNGVVPTLPTRFANLAAARQWITDQLAIQLVNSKFEPFYHGSANQGVQAFWGSDIRPAGQGAQPDFAITMQTWPAVVTEDPRFLQLIWPDVMQHACRPNHRRRDDGSPYQANAPHGPETGPSHWDEGAPDGRYNAEGPNNMLGKPRDIGPGTVRTSHGHGWYAHSNSHYSINFLAGAYYMTGDPLLETLVHDMAEDYLSCQRVNTGNATGTFDQNRSVGRTLLAALNIWLCTNRADVRARAVQRIQISIPLRFFNNQFIKTFEVTNHGIVEFPPGSRDFSPWQMGFAIPILYWIGQLWNEVATEALNLMRLVGDSNILYQWETTGRAGPGINQGHFVISVNHVNPNLPPDPRDQSQWIASHEFNHWGLGAARIMAQEGTTPEVRTRALAIIANVPRPTVPPSPLRTFEDWGNWWAALDESHP